MAVIQRILALFRPKKQDVSTLIARRAERVSNRKRDAADRYIAVHEALRGDK
jgi:hypothetical protein